MIKKYEHKPTVLVEIITDGNFETKASELESELKTYFKKKFKKAQFDLQIQLTAISPLNICNNDTKETKQ